MDNWRFRWGLFNDPGYVGQATRYYTSLALAETGAKMFGAFSGFRVKGGDLYTRYKKTMAPSYYTRGSSGRLKRIQNEPLEDPFNPPSSASSSSSRSRSSSNASMQTASSGYKQAVNTLTDLSDLEKKNMVHGSQAGAITSAHSFQVGNMYFHPNLIQTYGSSFTYEDGAVAGSTNTKVLYLQLGTPVYQQIRSVFRAMLMALLHKHGIHLKTWDVVSGLTGQVIINYRNIQTGSNSAIVYTFASTETYATIASQWASTFVGQIENPSHGGLNEWDFFRMQLRLLTAAPSTYIDAAILYMENFDVNVYQKYALQCQNQTAADTATEFSTQVSNVNPIQCKTFYINGQHAKLNVEDYGAPPGGATNFVPDTNSGYFNYGTTATTGPSVMKKIPQSNVFERVIKTLPQVTITPGQLVRRTLSKTYKMSLNYWFSGLADMGVTTTNLVNSLLSTEYGCNMVLAFEKTLNTRGAEEVGVAVGSQWTSIVGSFLSTKTLQPTNAIIQDI